MRQIVPVAQVIIPSPRQLLMSRVGFGFLGFLLMIVGVAGCEDRPSVIDIPADNPYEVSADDMKKIDDVSQGTIEEDGWS